MTSILAGTGIGTDAANPRGRKQTFLADMRVMSGDYIGVDGREHEGTFGFF
ncbi:MAG: hypothetical protein NVS2B9_04390 [Myxococcales bacterium]